MRKKIFTFLLALAASVGMMNAKVTWNSCNMSNFSTDQPYTLEGVTLRANASFVQAYCDGNGDEIHFFSYETGGFTFSNTLGKNFTKIEMFLTSSDGWGNLNLGSGWSFMNNGPVTWTGNASTVDLLKDEGDFGVASVKIVFHFEGDSQEPDPVLVTANTLQLVADPIKGSVAVTNLLCSGIVDNGDGTYDVPEGAEVTLQATPNEGYEFIGWKAGSVGCDFTDCGNALSTVDNPLTFDMNNEVAFMAEFAAVAPQPAGPTIPCTAADLGKVLCTDGSIYATVSEASAASKTAAAVITYVDTENNKGLALALANESGTMDWETAKTTAAAHTPAVSGGTWTLPSKDDWDHMISAAGGYGALCNGFSAVGGTNIQDGWYWTSVEYYPGSVICLRLRPDQNDGGYALWETNEAYSVRACLAFDISAAPAPAEDVDITPNADPQHANVYYSTFFDSANKYALPAGVEAYVATRDGANLLLSKIADAGQTIPANNAVILKSTVTPFTLTVSEADAVTFTATNDLQGSDTQIATPANCYVLAGNDGVGFYHYTASMLNPHKAYVIYSGSNQAPKRMPFVFNQATGVDEISQEPGAKSQKLLENGVLYIIKNGVKYNAQGQVVK